MAKILTNFWTTFSISDHGEIIQEKRQAWYINDCKMSRVVKSLQSILKPICELLISKYADICDFEAVMCILQNIDNKNPIWFYSSKINVYDEATILHWAAKFGQLSVIQYVCRLVATNYPISILVFCNCLFWKWSNTNPQKIFRQVATETKL